MAVIQWGMIFKIKERPRLFEQLPLKKHLKISADVELKAGLRQYSTPVSTVGSNGLPIKLLPFYHSFILRFNCWL